MQEREFPSPSGAPFPVAVTLETMNGATSTLRVGDRTPGFRLKAANRFDAAGEPQEFSLGSMRRPLILEFLRGTW